MFKSWRENPNTVDIYRDTGVEKSNKDLKLCDVPTLPFPNLKGTVSVGC